MGKISVEWYRDHRRVIMTRRSPPGRNDSAMITGNYHWFVLRHSGDAHYTHHCRFVLRIDGDTYYLLSPLVSKLIRDGRLSLLVRNEPAMMGYFQ